MTKDEIGKLFMDLSPYLLDCPAFVNLANTNKGSTSNNLEYSVTAEQCSNVKTGEYWSSDSVTIVILDDIEIIYPKTGDFTRVGRVTWIDSCTYRVTLQTDGGDGILKKGDQYSSKIIQIKNDTIIWETDFKGLKFKYFLIKK